MAVQTNFPAVEPNLLLDFANTRRLDPRITFVRTTTATYYDGTTSAKAEENLFNYSQILNVGWVKVGTATITDNNTTSPDGTSTAALLASPATGDFVYQVPTTIIGQTYVYSVFVKNSTATVSTLYVRFSTTGALIYLNWSGATLSSLTQTTGTATFSSVGNDWYRVVVTYTAVEASARHRIYGGDVVSTTGNIYAWGAQLEQRSSVTAYTATTTQPITNYIPVLQTAAAGVARFDHNPTTDESLGLLVEEARTNLLTYSADFTNAVWNKWYTNITSNIITSPIGTLTGSKLFEDTTSGVEHYVEQTIATNTNQTYTQSIYVKAGETANFRIMVVSVGASSTTSTSILSVSSGVITFTYYDNLITSATATHVGNGWYRCAVVYTLNGTVTSHRMRIYPKVAGLYTGDGYSGIYIWGAQLEVGAFSTSYIPTVASTVTRNADSLTMTDANFTSWFNGTEGTIYGEFSRNTSPAASQFPQVVNIDNGTTLNTRLSLFTNSGRVLQAQMAISAVFNSINTGQSWSLDVPARFALAYQAFNHAAAASGFAAVTRVDTDLPKGLTTLRIGDQATGGGNLNGTIRKIAYYPVRISNANIQALTS